MLKLAHIINPLKVDKTSDLYIAQPITFETMRIAARFARPDVEIKQYTIQSGDSPLIDLSPHFISLPNLNRTIADIKTFARVRKLPLIKDILDPLYETADVDYLIYTNVDIALQPHFYQAVSRLIQQGYDAFIINRRTIPAIYENIGDIPLMYAQIGEKHKGWDCFIFRRDLYPMFRLGNTIIGAGWFGRVMIVNMACFAERFRIYEDLHLTFHIGNEQAWKTPQWEEYREHNRNECRGILEDFEKEYGPFDRGELPGRFWRALEKAR